MQSTVPQLADMQEDAREGGGTAGAGCPRLARCGGSADSGGGGPGSPPAEAPLHRSHQHDT